MNEPNYWIAVISKDHSVRGVEGGFIQVNHGKQAPLKRIRQNDWVLVYSPKLSMESGEKCQAFTAIGQATDDAVYQVKMSDTFEPFRRAIKFYACKEFSILPLIEQLEFIQNKKSWGFLFRFGFFDIPEKDFIIIKSKMLPHEVGG